MEPATKLPIEQQQAREDPARKAKRPLDQPAAPAKQSSGQNPRKKAAVPANPGMIMTKEIARISLGSGLPAFLFVSLVDEAVKCMHVPGHANYLCELGLFKFAALNWQ